MKVELVTNPQEIPISRNEWNTLLSHSETNTPFQTYEWLTSWWSIFGESNSLFLLFFYDGERLAGIAPLMIAGTRKKTLRFISDSNADYCDFIVRKKEKKMVIATLCDYVIKKQSHWGSLYLQNIPEQSETSSLLQEVLSAHGLYFSASSIPCPVLKLTELQAEAQLEPSKTLRRRLNHFARHGELSFTIFHSLEEAAIFLEDFFQQHIQRWSIMGKPSLFLDNRYRDFYHDLLRQAWPTGWLFFSCLTFNGHPIAFHFGFDYNSRVIWYKPSFDIAYRKHSPGRVFLKYLIDYCLESDKEELDFSLGDEPFKRDYTNDVRLNTNYRIFKSKNEYLLTSTLTNLKKILKTLYRRFREI